MHSVKLVLKKASNWSSWHTDRKLIAIASDDWGGIRVASKKSQSALSDIGLAMDTNRFNLYDRLENNDDMDGLFNVLTSHKDSKGNHPVITAACTIGNPNFEKIKESNFTEYHYELFPETLKRFSDADKVFSYYQQGIAEGFFVPEFHGREHLNVPVWMQALQEPVSIVRKAFEQSYFHLEPSVLPAGYPSGFGTSFGCTDPSDKPLYQQVLADGLTQFESLFGYKSSCIIPPEQGYFDDLDGVALQHNVLAIDRPLFSSGSRIAQMVSGKQEFNGKRNKNGLVSVVRNAVFEPNMDDNSEGIDECLAAISFNFECRVPAIISNHRAAFVGGIDSSNRDKGLKALDSLLMNIIKKWPDVEFISIKELITIIENERKG